MHNRRNFLKQAGAGILALPLLQRIATAQSTSSHHTPLTPIQIPRLTLNVRDFGALGDGKSKDTAAFQLALDRCAVLGGGEVVVPAGNYVLGSTQLRSNTTLRMEKDAVLSGSPEEADYPITQIRWEGKWLPGHIGLLYAIDAQNVAITGPGHIEGFTPPNVHRNSEIAQRRPVLIEFLRCRNILLDGFSTHYYGMWSVHPTLCEDFTARNLTIRSEHDNGDGIDADSCRRVLIEHCDIATGDDCIALKSGRGSEAWMQAAPTEDVMIRNCTFNDSLFACIGIGTEASGSIRRVKIEHCTFTGAKSNAIYIKSRIGRGGSFEEIHADNLEIKGMRGAALRINLTGVGKQDQNPVPGMDGIATARDLRFSNIRVENAPVLFEATHIHPDRPIDGLTLTHVTGTAEKGISLANIRNVEIGDVKVTGLTTPLLSLASVTGKGLEGATSIEAPTADAPIPAPAEAYRLR